MFSLNKVEIQLVECRVNYTPPPNPSTPAVLLKIVAVHPNEHATGFLVAGIGPEMWPQITVSEDDNGEVDLHPSYGRQIQENRAATKDIEKGLNFKHEENENFELRYASLRSFPNHEGNEYSTRVREEDISLTGLMQHPAPSGSSASCPPSSQMWYPHEEQGSNGSTALGQNLDETAIGFEWQKFFNNGRRVWNIFQDNEILRRHYAVRQNIVLDSTCPQSTPHIVLTPAEETWDDQMVAWENRVESQWMGNLMVPIVSALWLPPPLAPSSEPTIHTDYDPSLERINPIGVFSISKFNKFIESASTERLVLCQLVRTLQKQQCRAVFFHASTVAQSFRERYNASLDCFKSFELPFVWDDPAEPILAMCSKLLGTTIIDSPCPFLIPHIIICTPPPQDFWIPWNNATNDPQDQGFGNYLIVPSVTVGVINPAEVSSWESASCASFESAVDTSESPPTPSSSLPDTPVDERDDLDYFLTRHGDFDEAGMETDFNYQSLCGLPPIQEEYPENESTKLPLRPIFSIEDDEDDLPPFDDWYK